MKKFAVFTIIICILSLLTGCNKPIKQSTPSKDSSDPEGDLINKVHSTILDESNIQKYEKSGDWEYNIYDSFIEITGYNGSDKDVIIPNEINELPVRVLQNDFNDKLLIEKLTIPQNLVFIAGYSRSMWGNLKDIVFQGTQLIGYSTAVRNFSTDTVFNGFYSKIPAMTTALAQKIIDHIYKNIPAYMFHGCENISSLHFGENIESIGEHAFWCCTSLSAITCDGVQTIESQAFWGCDRLKTVTVKKDNCEYGGGYLSPFDQDEITFKGYSGSTTERFAAENRYLFTVID